MLITLEGIDGTGKAYQHAALVAAYEARGGEVIATREPGDIDFNPVEIERHLNDTRLFTWAAIRFAEDAGDPYASKALLGSLLLHYNTEIPADVRSWMRDLTGETEEPVVIRRVRDQHAPLTRLLDTDDALWARLFRYGIRNCIRHALMHAENSRLLTATQAGLLFYANHWRHQIEVIFRQPQATIISDRYAESELAYGAAFGANRIVFDLYKEGTLRAPDVTVLLTVDPLEAHRRLQGRSAAEQVKQQGKAWGALQVQARAQQEYLRLSQRTDYYDLNPHAAPHNWIIVDTTNKSQEAVAREIQNALNL
jgi:thymidylate kinase